MAFTRTANCAHKNSVCTSGKSCLRRMATTCMSCQFEINNISTVTFTNPFQIAPKIEPGVFNGAVYRLILFFYFWWRLFTSSYLKLDVDLASCLMAVTISTHANTCYFIFHAQKMLSLTFSTHIILRMEFCRIWQQFNTIIHYFFFFYFFCVFLFVNARKMLFCYFTFIQVNMINI